MELRTAALILAGVFALSGLTALGASLADSDWFFRSPSVRMLMPGLGRRWQRAVYGVFGMLMVIAAVCLVFGDVRR